MAKQQVEEYGLLTSLRVWYTDGVKVEFDLADECWSALPLDEGCHPGGTLRNMLSFWFLVQSASGENPPRHIDANR